MRTRPTVCQAMILIGSALLGGTSVPQGPRPIHVDACAEKGPGDGTVERPFRTLAQAAAEAAARPGTDVIRLASGFYPETRVIRTPVVLEPGPSSTASARIGEYGPRVARLRILTHNIFGLDDFCEQRGARFGECVANGGRCPGTAAAGPFQIVAVQEFWYDAWQPWYGHCDNDATLNAITAGGDYLNESGIRRQYLFKPGRNFLVSWLTPNGGLGTFTTHRISEKEDWDWGDGHDVKCRRQGFTFSRIALQDPAVAVDVWNVHLCGECDARCKDGELKQLRKKIIERSRASGNPAIVVGDFNIEGPLERGDPHGELYDAILRRLGNPIDVWLEAGVPSEPGATTGDNERRIDFIFIITDPELASSRFVLRPATARVVRWTIEDLPVSDHFGVEAHLDIHACR
jgi:hypothetical protein